MHKKWLVVALAALLALGVLSGCTNKGKPAGTQEAVARMNGQDITDQVLTLRMHIFELFFQEPLTGQDIRYEMVRQMVTQRLLAEEAGRQGLSVEPAAVDQEVANFMAAVEQRYNSKADMTQKMKDLGVTQDDIKAFISEFLLSQKAVDAFRATVTVTDEELQKFYDENKTALYTFTEEVVRAAHILLKAEQESEAKNLVARLKAGEDFGVLAREYSADTGSARNGGDLGYFTRGTMVPEFADAAFALQPGELSDPTRSEFGWHIIKLIDRRSAGVLPFDLAREDVRNNLLPGKQDDAMQGYIVDLEEKAGAEILIPAPPPEPHDDGEEAPLLEAPSGQ